MAQITTMKKIILLVFLATSLNCYSQQDYPGTSIELLNGKELKVMPRREQLQQYGYGGFFTDKTLKKNYKKSGIGTKHSALVGKIFKIVSYEPHYSDYIITLENSETGILYYSYKTKYDEFPFQVIGGIEFPDGFYCKEISIDKKFNYNIANYEYTVRTPCIEDICVWYYPDSKYRLHFLITDASPVKETGLKGITIFFKNGTELVIPDAVIEVEPASGKYNFKTLVTLTESQLKILSENIIVRKKIGAHEAEVEGGKKIMELIKCLYNKTYN